MTHKMDQNHANVAQIDYGKLSFIGLLVLILVIDSLLLNIQQIIIIKIKLWNNLHASTHRL